MHHISWLLIVGTLLASGEALGQGLPTSQPALLQIYREEVKIGHDADHVKTEVGWPAAFEKAKFPYYSLALVSMTGAPEAWFVVPFESHAALADAQRRQNDPVLAAELARLQKADAQHLTNVTTIQAAARKDLGYGAFPETAKQRFWEITTFRVRPGHEEAFAAAARAYGLAAGRIAPGTSYRVYEVIAGMPGPTYLVFGSTTGFGEFDRMMADGMATMKGANAEERAALQKFSVEGLVSVVTHRFRVDPEMSYVPREVREQDPAFWIPKRPAVKTSPR